MRNYQILFFFIFLARVLNNQECGLPNPINELDCFISKELSEKNYCCLLTNLNDNSLSCKSISKDIYNNSNLYVFGNNKYYAICIDSKIDGQSGTSCGKTKTPVTDRTECWKHSSPTNKCCSLTNIISNITNCFWLGKTISTLPYSFTNQESLNLTINCKSNFIHFLYINALIILLFI